VLLERRDLPGDRRHFLLHQRSSLHRGRLLPERPRLQHYCLRPIPLLLQ
jgi:hypothetical protein